MHYDILKLYYYMRKWGKFKNMKSSILNELFKLESFKEVDDRNIEKYNRELSQIESDSAINVKELLRIIKDFGKWHLFEESMSDVKEELLFKHDLHGISHNERVAIFVFAIGILENLNDNDLKILLEAAKYHDIGRVNNGIDGMHGARSAKKLDSIDLGLEDEEKELLKTICICHSSDDEKFEEIFKANNIKDVSRCRILANILKDADALDRVRLPRTGLDTKYLRTEAAKRMSTGAYELFYNYNEVKRELEEKEVSKLEIKKDIDSKLFDIDQFTVIEDEENYYYFRAVTENDLIDLENGAGLKTNRERTETARGTAKYSAGGEISLQEIWDHIRYGHSKETNCISLSSNSNVVIDYGQRDQNKYVMIKVPKDKGENVYNAGQYMLEEINKAINEAIKKIPEDSKILTILKKIDSQDSYRAVRTIVADVYDGIKKTRGKYTGKNNRIKSKESIVSRFDRKQYFTDEQQLEYNKIIAKLTVLETMGELRSILPTQADNSSLIATVGMAFSSGEIIHYKDIDNERTIQISSEMLDMISVVQQLKEKDIDRDSIKALEQKLLKLINDGYQIKRENGQLYLSNGSNIIRIRDIKEEPFEEKRELTIEDLYRKTDGRISYYKAKETIEFINNVKNSKYKVYEYADIIRVLTENEELAKIIEEECYAIDSRIISRRNNEGIQISESVNISLDRIDDENISKQEKDRLLQFIKELNNKSSLDELEQKVLTEILETEEPISENQYFAEAIVDGLEFEKIYKSVLEEKRTMSKEEREILISKLRGVDCKKLYNAFEKVGANPHEISRFIINLVLNEGYKGYSLEELSKLENLDEIISKNVKNNNLRNSISPLKLDIVLGIKDDSFEIEGTEIVLREYQRETLENIDEIFEEKRFAGMILPTGAGKSFVAMAEIMKFKGKNVVFIAPQNTILHQFEVHVLKNILHKKIITEEEIKRLKEKGEPIPENVIQPKDFKKVLQQEFPNLKMFCYEGLADKSEEWLEARDADFIILDELHRAGAKTWEPQIKKLIDLNPNAKILGMTATPIRDVDGKDMARGIAEMTGDYTEEELIDKEYLASEMHLLDAMQDGYVVSPKIVTFDYTLTESDEYHEITKMIETEKDSDKLKELIKIKNEMDAIIRKSQKEGMSGIFKENIKKVNGKYIIFLPQNPDTKNMSSEEYIKAEIEKVKEYFKGVNPNIKTSYLLSDRKNAKRENLKALEEFEASDSDALQLLFAVDMLNEGVHVDGIDGVVMMRPINENSKILYLQQIGRCIFSEDPEHPTADEDRPIIFDVYNNYLAQNMDREANKTNYTSDLQRLRRVIKWIDAHKGYMPDINSEDIKEAKKAITLKNIQKKYKKYLEGIENKNLSKGELYEIQQIVELGKQIGLWDLEIPDRIIPPGEKDIARNDTFKVTGTQREFIDLFKKAKELTKGKTLTTAIRIKGFINLVDILNEYGLEISNDTIKYGDTLKDILEKMPEDIRDSVLYDISELNTVIDKDFKIGEEYNYVKESFYLGKPIFLQYDVKDLRRYGIFETFIKSRSKAKELSSLGTYSYEIEKGFIKTGPSELMGININTGTIYDEEGYDEHGVDKFGFSRGQVVDRNHFGRNGHYYIKDENGEWIDTGSVLTPSGLDRNGDYWIVDEDGNPIENTHKKFGSDGYSLDDVDELGYDRKSDYWYGVDLATGKKLLMFGKSEDEQGFKKGKKVNIYHFGRNGHYYVKDENGEWIDTGRKLNSQNLDKNGDYWIVDEEGNPIENTHTKFGLDGYSLYGINENGFSKRDRKWHDVDKKSGKGLNLHGELTDEEGYDFYNIGEFNFGRNGHYYVKNKKGEWIDTGRKLNPQNLDKNGDYWIVDEKGNPIENTHTKFGSDGYSLYGINERGFSKYDKLWHDVDKESGKPLNAEGKITDEEGYDFYDVGEFNFGRNGHYYTKNKDGVWIDTGRKLNLQNLDKNGDYWLVDEGGNPIENTHTKFGLDGYSLYGINERGFSKNDKLWYDVDLATGKPKNDEGYYRDSENYDFNGIDTNGQGRDGKYYKIYKGKIYDVTEEKLRIERNKSYGVNSFGFGNNSHYYEKDENGDWIDTGKKLNPQNLDKNGDYWIVDEEGNPIKNMHTKFGLDGYSLYGINERGFSGKDKLWYDVDLATGKGINAEGELYDKEGLDFYLCYETGYNKYNITRYGFDKDGYYYKRQEDGTYINTGKKYNDYGFKADRKHIITKTRVDLRRFNIDGLCKDNDDSIYDKNGFKQDGTYLETGEKYHNGYNAYDVDKEGKDRRGKIHKDIIFTQEYINAVKEGKRTEFIRAEAKKHGISINRMEEEIIIKTYRAQEMYPELEERVRKELLDLQKLITMREIRIKRLIQSKSDAKLVVENLKKEIAILKQKINYINPMAEIEK